MIYVANKKRKLESIQKDYPNAIILDITSSSPHRYGQLLSPFYPHRNIPIPGDSRGMTAICVEAIWQGLKVFEGAGIDRQMFQNDTMHHIKRTVRKYGKPLGHQFGVFSKEILNYADARRYIYVPTYKYVLDNVPEVHSIVERIKKQSEISDIVLLDYNLNHDNRDITKPLSHAELVKMYIEGRYPSKDEDFVPFTPEELKAQKQKRHRRSTVRNKIETLEDKNTIANSVCDILSTSERSSLEIVKLLHLDIKLKDLNELIRSIPGVKERRVKGRVYFTLGKQELTPTLL